MEGFVVSGHEKKSTSARRFLLAFMSGRKYNKGMKNASLIQAVALCTAAVLIARKSGYVCRADADEVDVVALLTEYGLAYTEENCAALRRAVIDALDAQNALLSA